jgi:5-oxoprolinase (ATP-hydrolysing) subunit A
VVAEHTEAAPTVDLNADVGEGFGQWRLTDDAALLEVVSSANVACGFHAGDPSTMRRLCEVAVERGVSIGAHVGYRDLAGFGRRFVDVSPDELRDDVVYQVAALVGTAASVGATVRYVKPHGALYNAIVHHHDQARAVVAAVAAVDRSLPLLGLPGSVALEIAAEAGLPTVTEAFADRAYTAQGTLVPRGVAGAVLHDVEEISRRVVAMATGEPVSEIGGAPLHVRARSVCVHGDTPGAVAIARAVREALTEAGVTVSAFA